MHHNTFLRKTAALFVAAAIAASAMPVVSYAAMNTSEFDPGYSYSTTMRGLTAFQIVNDMGAGWNLGNTLESANNETYWGNPTTTKAMIDTIAARGFTTLRVPVRWDDHYSNSSSYTIDSSYMDRVETVVNYGLANDMYVILNVHHNDLQHNVPNTDAISAELSAVWKQIGERFKNYGDKLIFEVNNEPRADEDWTGNSTYYDSVNECNEAARAAIRATGGNNTERLVMLPTYCASGDAAKAEAWSKNAADDMIAASIHAYLPFDFAFTPSGHSDWLESDLTELQGFFDRMYTYFLSKDIPVVIGEFGAVNKSNTSYREQYTAIYGQLARQFAEQDIPCVWWDNNCFNTAGENFGIFNRRANSFVYEGVDCGGIADGLINAYSGDPVFETATTGETVIFEGSATESNYKQPVSFSPDYVTSMGADDAIYVKYSGDTPYMVLQSWSSGEKWITVDADSNSNGVLTFKRSTLLSKFGGSFTGLDKAYVSAQAGTTTVTKVYIPGSGAHTHNYNGTEIITIAPTETTYGRKAVSCSGNGCDAVKISVIDRVAAVTLDAPVISSATESKGSVTIAWNTVSDATSYRVFRADSANGTKKQLAIRTTPNYTDTTVEAGKIYYYFVAAFDANTSTLSKLSEHKSITVKGYVDAPAITSISQTDGAVTLAWNTVSNATSYRVFRADSANGVKTQLVIRTTPNYTDTTVQAGKTYYYFVAAFNANTSTLSELSAYKSIAVKNYVDAPVISSVSQTDGAVTIKWNTVSNATSYRVFRSDSANGAKTQLVIRTSPNYTDTTVQAGKTYYYYVAAFNSNTSTLSKYSDGKSVKVNETFSAPVISAVSIVDGNVTLSWEKVNGATSYRVYRADSATGTRKLLKVRTSLNYTDTTAVSGNTYYYYVCAYNADSSVLSGFSAYKAVTLSDELIAPVVTSVTSSNDNVYLAWSVVENATSYRIFRADSATGAKKLLKVRTTPSYVDTTAVAGNTYYYFIASYNTNTKTLSNYTPANVIACKA